MKWGLKILNGWLRFMLWTVGIYNLLAFFVRSSLPHEHQNSPGVTSIETIAFYAFVSIGLLAIVYSIDALRAAVEANPIATAAAIRAAAIKAKGGA